MKSIRIATALLSLSIVAACGPGVDAQAPQPEPADSSYKDIGDYVVHFSAQTTDNLPLEVAQTYSISRNPYSAMLTVSIIDERTNKSVTGEVEVNAVNLTGQMKDVTMRLIQEQDATYYIGVTPIVNMETLRFDITVRPNGVEEASEVSFQRTFYTK